MGLQIQALKVPALSVPVAVSCLAWALSASSSRLREVTGLRQCPQNTNSLGASVWEKGGGAGGRSHELIGGGQSDWCWVSQSPALKVWSLFDFALLMVFFKVKQNRSGPLLPPLGLCLLPVIVGVNSDSPLSVLQTLT